jgi:hypothetical protein
VEAVGALSGTAAAHAETAERILDTLIELLNKSPRTLVRRRAVQGMTLLKSPRTVEALMGSILDLDRPLTALIREALKAINTPEAQAALAKRDRGLYEGR